MSGWLAGFRSSEPDASAEPQPFELVCECSVRHTGMRRKGHQRIVCRTCGAALYVSPRNPYPASSVPKPAKKSRPRTKPVDDDDEPRNAFAPAGPRRKSRHQRRREEESEPGADPLRSAAELAAARVAGMVGAAGSAGRATVRRVSQSSRSAAAGVWNFWTPLRLTGLGIAVVLTAIALWTVHARRVEQAAHRLNPAIEAGLAALQQGNVPEAAAQLAIAVDALDVLRRDDSHAAAIRQTQREAAALQGLSSETLLSLLDQADGAVESALQSRPAEAPEKSAPPPPLDADWASRFNALYRGGWVVLEAPVKRLKATEQEQRRYDAEFPITIGPKQRAVEVRANFEAFDRLGIKDSPRRAIFGGRLQSCRLSEDEQRWIVELDPPSGFLWSTLRTYQLLGFAFSEWHPRQEVERILSEQAESLGVKPLLDADAELPKTPTLAPG